MHRKNNTTLVALFAQKQSMKNIFRIVFLFKRIKCIRNDMTSNLWNKTSYLLQTSIAAPVKFGNG